MYVETVPQNLGLHTEKTSMANICEHVYRNVNANPCPKCGRETHEINWAKENEFHKQWLKDNPDAWKTVGWWSI